MGFLESRQQIEAANVETMCDWFNQCTIRCMKKESRRIVVEEDVKRGWLMLV